MKNTADIKKAIERILSKAGYSFTVTNHGLGRMNEANERDMNKWSVSFVDNTTSSAVSFDYYTGTGLQHMGKPVPPCAADVLFCLLNDRSAVGQTFEEWASDYGYDTDSRAAERIYNACIMNANKLDSIFSGGQQAELAELLQDY
jgi:hypothetical protein